jgi:hypothetical protein
MATTLDDIKAVLETIATQGARGTGPSPADKIAKEENNIAAAQERVRLAQEEVDAMSQNLDIRSSISEALGKETDRSKAALDLENAKIAAIQAQAAATEKYDKKQRENFKRRVKQRSSQQNQNKRDQINRASRSKATKEYLSQNVQILKQSASIGLNQSAIGRSIASGASSAMGMIGTFAALVTSAISFAAALAAAGVALGVIAAIVLPLVVVFGLLAAYFAVLGTSVALVAFVVSLAVEVRDLTAAFTMATGASMDFGKEIVQVHKDFVMAGVSLEDANKAYQTLYKNTTIFSQALPSQRKRMGAFVAMLEQWGISAETSSKAMEIAVVSLGISVNNVGDEMTRLSEHAKFLSVDVGTYMQEFAAAASELAVYEDAVGTFKELARVQKITGMEMRKIIDLSRKFDTFEGAAKMAGNLNAALGGNFVNAMDMMTQTDPVKRFEMIRDALKDGGVEFENMGYYAKRFYMEQLGLKDVSELAQLMRGDLNDLSGDYGKSADELLALKNRTRDYQSTLDVLKNLLSTMKPVFIGLIDPIQDLVKQLVGADGPTDQFLEIRDAITSLTKDAILPLMKSLPNMLTNLTTWLTNNKDLIDNFIAIVPQLMQLAIDFGISTGNMAVGGMANVAATTSALAGDQEATARSLEMAHDSWMKSGHVYRALTQKFHNYKFLALKGLAWFNSDSAKEEAEAITNINKAMNTPGSPTYLESLAIQNELLSKMPGNISNASTAMASMSSPISSAAVEMNKLGESTAATVDEAKKLFKPGTFKATGTVGFQEVMTGRASAGVTGPAATSTAPQNASPIVKQPVEVVLRTEEGVLAKHVINVIGREIQAVIS